MRRKLVLMLVLTMIFTLLAGYNTQSTAVEAEGLKPTDEGSGTIRLYATRSLETLNPHMFNASATADFIEKISGYLYRLMPTEDGKSYRIVPEMADGEPVQVDNEGKVWQVKVNSAAKWANGKAITADDFEYSWKMLLDPVILNERADLFKGIGLYILNGSEYFTQVADGTTVEWKDVGIKAIDTSTIQIILTKAVSCFTLKNALAQTELTPVYKELYEAGMNEDRSDTTYGTNVQEFMSSGPFKLDGWVRDLEYVAVKNPMSLLKDYVWLAKISTKVISEAGTAVQLFESGQLDYVSLDNANYARYSEDPRLVELPHRTVYHMVINTINQEKPILQNKKFRQALSYGTNRAKIGELALVEPANYYITDYYVADVDHGILFRDTDQAKAILKPNHGYDPEKAKQLFNEALEEAGIDRIALEINYHDGRESRKLASEYIQSAWPELFGKNKISVTLQAIPSSQLAAKLRSHVDDTNAFEIGWTGSSWTFLDHTSVVKYFHSETARRKWPYFSDEYDALVEQLRKVPNNDKQTRIELAAQLEAMLLEDVPSIPVFRSILFRLFSDRIELAVKNYSPIIGWGFMWAKKVN